MNLGFLTASLICLGLAGCAPAAVRKTPAPTSNPTPANNLTIYDPEHHVVATGTLKLSRATTQLTTFSGSWHLASSNDQYPPAPESNRFRGNHVEGKISIDLNPGVADSNVILFGDVTGEKLSGQWYYEENGGGGSKGTFEVTLEK